MREREREREIETTHLLCKDIEQCTTRFYLRTIDVPYLCQLHDSHCEIKSIFKCWQLLSHIPTYNVKELEKQLNKEFESVCDWFVDNKLSIHFGEDKTKSILFASKCKIKSARELNVEYEDIKIKQHLQVTYLGCVLDKTFYG